MITANMTADEKRLRSAIIKNVKALLVSHADGTMGFCAFDTEGNIVHIHYKINCVGGVTEVYARESA